MSDYRFRDADAHDVPTLFSFLLDLAAHERRTEMFNLSLETLQRAFDSQHIKALVCLQNDQPVGMAMWCDRFSSYAGGVNLLLIDLYVAATHRSQGLGKRFIAALKQIAHRDGYVRIEWFVDADNEAAKRFYTQIGGERITRSEHWKLLVQDL